MTIGAYPAFTIKQACDKHEELRALVARGESPAKVKQRQTVERRAAEASAVAFDTFAQRWIDEMLFDRSDGYRAQIVRWLGADGYVFPSIFRRSVPMIWRRWYLLIDAQCAT